MKRVPVVLALVAGLLLPLGAADVATAAPCTNPQFVTSDENGMWFDGKYVVHNNMWNVSGYDVTETLAACSHGNWKVTATADNSSGDGAVKTYPNRAPGLPQLGHRPRAATERLLAHPQHLGRADTAGRDLQRGVRHLAQRRSR